MYQRQAGFTLIEIAIVLVIIGLLLGGVLKGQELIENAKIKSVRNDFNGIEAAYYAYQDRYKELPGDDPLANAASRNWANGIVGNDNGQIGTTTAFNGGASENQRLWQHLRYANLLSGNPAGAVDNTGGRANPLHAYNGMMGMAVNNGVWLGLSLNGTVLCAGSLPAKAAQSIDSSFDDGIPNTGTVRAMAGPNNIEPSGAVATAAAAYLDGTIYSVCKSLG